MSPAMTTKMYDSTERSRFEVQTGVPQSEREDERMKRLFEAVDRSAAFYGAVDASSSDSEEDILERASGAPKRKRGRTAGHGV